MHRDFNAILQALLADHRNPYDWEDLLLRALFALRTAVCRSTGLALYQILFGRDCSSPIDNIFGGPSDGLDEPGVMDYLQKLRKCVLNAHKYARKHLSVAVRHQRRQYHKERKDFHAGTKVWLFTPTLKKGLSAKLTCYWSGPWIVCAEPTSSETLLTLPDAPDPSWAKQLKNSGTRVVSIDRLKLYNNTKAVRVLECEDALDMDDDEFAENITLPTKNEPQVVTAGTGTSGDGSGGGGGGASRATDDPDTREDKPPTPVGLAPGPWRATPRKSSSSSVSYSSDSSSTSQNTEKDLLDSTTASEVPGESFLLTPPRFEFNEPHVDAPVPMDTTTSGPSKTTAAPSQRDPTAGPSKVAATPAKQPVEDPSPSTGTIRKRLHGATPFGTKGVVR